MPSQFIFLFTFVFLLSSCGKVGPYVPENNRPKLTPHEANAVMGNVNGKDWQMGMGDVKNTSTNAKKTFSIRLSDSTDISVCSKDNKPAFTDRRIYIDVDAKLGETNVGENYGSVYFSYYRKDSSFIFTAKQGTVKITSITDQSVEGTIQISGDSQNASGFFSATHCSN